MFKMRAEDGTEVEVGFAWPEAREPYTEEQMQPVRQRIEWHAGCEGRHGVIRGVSEYERDLVALTLAYYSGEGCDHWRGHDVEFVPMTKVYPPPTTPWGWCGKSVLWPERKAGRR